MPTLRGSTVQDDASLSQGTHDVAIPSGSVSGDFAIVTAYINNPRVISGIAHVDGTSAWDITSTPNNLIAHSEVGGFQNAYAYGRFLTSGDITAGTIRVTLDAASAGTFALDVWDGTTVDNTNPVNGALITTGSSNTPTAPSVTPSVANCVLVWYATDWAGGRQISPPATLPTGGTGSWSIDARTGATSGSPMTIAQVSLTGSGTATGTTAGSEAGAGDQWTAAAILLAPSQAPTITRTVTPVLISLSGSFTRTASPVQMSISSSNTLRTATPVHMAVSQSFTRTASPVSMAISQGSSITISVNGATVNQTIEGFGVNVNPQNSDFSNIIPAVDLFLNDLRVTNWQVDPFGNSNWIPNSSSLNSTFYNQIYSGARFTETWNLLSYLYARVPSNQVVITCTGIVSNFMSNTGTDGASIATGQESNFAAMIASMVDYGKRVMGLPITQISILNETDHTVGDTSNPEGPGVGVTQFLRIAKTVISQLDALGYSDVNLIVPALADAGNDFWLNTFLADSTAMARIHHFSHHVYTTPPQGGDFGPRISGSAFPDRTMWVTEWNQLVTDGDLDNGATVADEWAFAKQQTDNLISLIGWGATVHCAWDGWDNISVHHPHWTYWGMLGYSGPGYPTPGTNGTYTPKKRYYTNSQMFSFVPVGWRVIGASSSDPNVSIVAFYDTVSHGITLVGHNRNSTTITLNGSLSNVVSPSALNHFQTNSTLNRSLLGSVSVNSGSFSASVPADTFFTLSTVSLNRQYSLTLSIPVTPIAGNLQSIFSRGSNARQPDGSLLTSNTPRYQTGRNGQALLIEEGTTNLLSANNPALSAWSGTGGQSYGVATYGSATYAQSATDLPTFWSVEDSGSGIFSVSHDTTHTLFSPNSLHITASGGHNVWVSDGQQAPALTIDAAQTYTASVWVYLESFSPGTASAVPYVAIQRMDTFIDAVTTPVDVSKLNQWQQVSCTYSSGGTGTIPVRVKFQTNTDQSTSASISVYVGGIQMEQKSHATSFTSTTRNNEQLVIPRMTDMAQGTVEMVFSPTEDPNPFGHLFELGQFSSPITNDELNVMWGASATGLNSIQANLATAQGAQSRSSVATAAGRLQVGRWYYMAVRWDITGLGITLYDYANQTAYSSKSKSLSILPTFPGTYQLYVGSDSSGEAANVLVDEFRISNTVRSDAEVQASYQSSTPLPSDASTVVKMDFDGNLNTSTGQTSVTGLVKSIAKSSLRSISSTFATIAQVFSQAFTASLTKFRIVSSDSSIYYLSDVLRNFDVDNQKVVVDQRSGTARMFRKLIANKRVFNFSWSWLPFQSSKTLDSSAGGQDLQTLFAKGGVVTLYIPDGPSMAAEAVQCFVSMDGFSVGNEQFIGDDMYWDLSFSLEEI